MMEYLSVKNAEGRGLATDVDMSWMINAWGDAGTATVGGLVIGLMFGAFAQRSRFCLRAATVEFWRGNLGPKTAIWLLAFGAALFGTQALFATGVLDASAVRQLSTTGTMSGAMIGGLMFGAGMILARGCASRLLVLSATGNLRALIAGLILTVVAQASLRGVLSPIRQELASWWLVGAGVRNMGEAWPAAAGLAAGVLILALAIYLAWRHGFSIMGSVAAVGVAAGWWFNATLASQAFEIVTVQSISFTGPSADTLMALINEPEPSLGFGLGLVPGVFAGSFLMATATGEFRIQTFDSSAPLPRYIAGACLMGFGSMLAGGCAVGAGVTGGAVLALTAWVALTAMWVGAGLMDLLVDRRGAREDRSLAAAHVLT
jgi:uncharacterized membrane protein YedE/YeeE